MKIYSLLAKLFYLNFILIACSTKPEIRNQSENVIEQLPDIRKVIESDEFGQGSGIHSLRFKFTKKGRYNMDYWSEGWYWKNSGTYTITDQTVKLRSKECEYSQENDPGCKNTFTAGDCKIEESKYSLENRYILACYFNKKFQLFTSESKASNELGFDIHLYRFPAGVTRNHWGHEVVTTGDATGIVMESVILRSGPGIEFPKRDYVVNAYDGPFLKSVPKGKKVRVLARTPVKQKVKTWENYWLVISIDDSRETWAFGEFIQY